MIKVIYPSLGARLNKRMPGRLERLLVDHREKAYYLFRCFSVTAGKKQSWQTWSHQACLCATDDPRKQPPLDHLPDVLSAVYLFSVLPVFNRGHLTQSN
jgi:hypothetical protein